MRDGRLRSRKFLNAESFLKEMMQTCGDTMPSPEGTNAFGDTHRKILPYETVKSLYREYQWQCEISKTHPDEIAKETLFLKVFNSLKDEIRLLGCKGDDYFINYFILPQVLIIIYLFVFQ